MRNQYCTCPATEHGAYHCECDCESSTGTHYAEDRAPGAVPPNPHLDYIRATHRDDIATDASDDPTPEVCEQ